MSHTSNRMIEIEREKPVNQSKGAYWCAHCHRLVSAYSDRIAPGEDIEWHGSCGGQLEWVLTEDLTPLDRVPTPAEAITL